MNMRVLQILWMVVAVASLECSTLAFGNDNSPYAKKYVVEAAKLLTSTKKSISATALTNALRIDDLISVAGDGNLSQVISLVKKGVDVNYASNAGATPLLLAAQNGHIEIVKYLIERGAEVNHAKNDGSNPFFFQFLDCSMPACSFWGVD